MRTTHRPSGAATPGRTTPIIPGDSAYGDSAPGGTVPGGTVHNTQGPTAPSPPGRPPWPPAMFDRVACVRAVLQAHPEQAFSAAEIARRFTGARPREVRSILETFEIMGVVRELEDGRYCV